MIAAADVHYVADCGYAGCVTFADWADSEPQREYVTQRHDVHEYRPGEFWKRELPCLLAVLDAVDVTLQTVVIDGYVWLDGHARPGLGARLFDALGGVVSIVGVAKTAFRGSDHAARVFRPGSQRPLFVTAVGIGLEEAVAGVRRMAGAYRIPDLLKRVDRLSRQHVSS